MRLCSTLALAVGLVVTLAGCSAGCGHGCAHIGCPAQNGQELDVDLPASGDVAIHVCLDSTCDDVNVTAGIASSSTLPNTEGRVLPGEAIGGGVRLTFERGTPDGGPDTGPTLSDATLIHVVVTPVGGTGTTDRTARAGDGATGCYCPNWSVRL